MRCNACRTAPDPADARTRLGIDHIWPTSAAADYPGDDTHELADLQLLCAGCNSSKGSWIGWQPGRSHYRRKTADRRPVTGQLALDRCQSPRADTLPTPPTPADATTSLPARSHNPHRRRSRRSRPAACPPTQTPPGDPGPARRPLRPPPHSRLHGPLDRTRRRTAHSRGRSAHAHSPPRRRHRPHTLNSPAPRPWPRRAGPCRCHGRTRRPARRPRRPEGGAGPAQASLGEPRRADARPSCPPTASVAP